LNKYQSTVAHRGSELFHHQRSTDRNSAKGRAKGGSCKMPVKKAPGASWRTGAFSDNTKLTF